MASLDFRPGLAVVSLEAVDSGVAHVARLLSGALDDLCAGNLLVEQLAPAVRGEVSSREAVSFASRLAFHQAFGRADVWLFGHLGLARVQGVLPSFIRQPYAVFLHGIEAWTSDLGRSQTTILRNADLRLANSVFTARRVKERHPDVGAVQPCPLGLDDSDPGDVEGADRDVLSRIRSPAVLVVGRMSSSERYKGHDELLECWPRVVSAVPKAQLVVVGSGDDRGRIQEKARALLPPRSYLFTGFVEDPTLAAIRQRAAVFALPSRGEGFGLVYLEAMRAGLPCIGSELDAARDVIVDGETGLLVDPSDNNQLTEAIVYLLKNPAKRSRMGKAGRQRFLCMFTYPHFRHRLGRHLISCFGATE